MSAIDYADEMRRLSSQLDDALMSLRVAGEQAARTERDYRKARATAWLRCPHDEEATRSARIWTAANREDWVDGETADERMARDMADADRFRWSQAVKSRQVQISALQSLLAAERAEAEFARTGP